MTWGTSSSFGRTEKHSLYLLKHIKPYSALLVTSHCILWGQVEVGQPIVLTIACLSISTFLISRTHSYNVLTHS